MLNSHRMPPSDPSNHAASIPGIAFVSANSRATMERESTDDPIREIGEATFYNDVLDPEIEFRALYLMAKAEYRLRRSRDRVFAITGIFADPAWDILLDLFMASIDRKQISTSSACIAACVPPTTGLRWLAALESESLIVRVADSNDKRRTFVELTPAAFDKILEYFRAQMK